MILRWGLGAEELAWAAIFLVAPVSGVYYPIAVLPRVAAGRSRCALPSAHVFEGMRALLLAGRVPLGPLLGGAPRSTSSTSRSARRVFAWAMRYARERGTLLQMGE